MHGLCDNVRRAHAAAAQTNHRRRHDPHVMVDVIPPARRYTLLSVTRSWTTPLVLVAPETAVSLLTATALNKRSAISAAILSSGRRRRVHVRESEQKIKSEKKR